MKNTSIIILRSHKSMACPFSKGDFAKVITTKKNLNLKMKLFLVNKLKYIYSTKPHLIQGVPTHRIIVSNLS